MHDPFFFGYGSLVNRHTHLYTDAHRARVRGWRRAWVQTQIRETPFLTAIPCANSAIDGLVARVPGADWAALDLREAGYDRHGLSPVDLDVEGDHTPPAQIYAVSTEHMIDPAQKSPIVMSYLDVVVQGYLEEFGEEGAHAFFTSTDGWDTPVLNDRASPRYERHQSLTASERAFVDHHLGILGVIVLERRGG